MERHPAARGHDISTSDIFFVTDKVATNEVTIKYFPTGNMIADFFTKPLQGSLFQKFRDEIMNIDPAPRNVQDHRSVLKHGSADVHSTDGWTVVQKKKNKKKVTWKQE